MAINPESIASIGRASGGTAEAIGRGLSIADSMDRRQLNQLSLRQAQQEASDQARAREILSQSDLSSFEGQQKAAAEVTKVSPQLGMQVLRGFQQGQSTQNELTQQQYQIYGQQLDITGRAAAGLVNDYDNLVAKGVPPEQAVAQMTPKWQQTVQGLQQAKLPNGQPVLSPEQLQHLSANPGFNPDLMRTVANRSQEARSYLDKRFQERRQTAADARDERRVETAERREAAAEAALARKEEDKKAGLLTDEALDLVSERVLQGDKTALQNLGRGTQGSKNLAAVINSTAEKAKARGMDAAAIVRNIQQTAAEGRTLLELGAREGRIAPRVQEAQNFAKIALNASKNVPRGTYRSINKLRQMGEKEVSDPKLAAFRAANISLINAYAAAVGGGTIKMHDQVVAAEMLSTADSPEAYEAIVNQLLTETQAALDAPRQVMDRIHAQGSGSAAPAAQAAPKVGDVLDGYTYLGGDPSQQSSWRAP